MAGGVEEGQRRLLDSERQSQREVVVVVGPKNRINMKGKPRQWQVCGVGDV